MPTYAIGDVQGCLSQLKSLLQTIQYDPSQDQLWFAGDLVNRGPESLETLRFIKNLSNTNVVLGNHDLFLLAAAVGVEQPRPGDTVDDILQAPDRDQLMDWLRQQPLMHYDEQFDCVLVHAGLLPQWDLKQALKLAKEVSDKLSGPDYQALLENMYGDQPNVWRADLQGWDRLRVIINGFTRLRFCDESGHMNLRCKGEPGSQPAGLMPWFDVPGRNNATLKILFGHWAALSAEPEIANAIPLDTGCVWGRELTALRLDDNNYFSVPGYKREN